jgi:N-acetylglucosamine kinase-like BadF-type ATPase
MSIYLGLDCGGSSCRAAAVDDEGRSVFRGEGGPANIASTPDSVLRESLRQAVHNAPRPTAVCACFAGLLTRADRIQATKILRDLFPGAVIRVEPDYAAALSICPPEADACVIAGTGALICSWKSGKAGRQVVKTGGGGYLLGDVGSAFDFGRAALKHWLDLPEPPLTLTKAIQNHFGSTERDEVIAALYRSPSPPAALASLAPALAKLAQEGEAFALSSVRVGCAAIADCVWTHWNTHHPELENIRIALFGGLWSTPFYVETFRREMNSRDGMKLLGKVERPPVEGAIALAREMVVEQERKDLAG